LPKTSVIDIDDFLLEMSSKSIHELVPLFEGKDWNVWSQTMTAFLCSQGLWSIVNGTDPKPREYSKSSGANTAQIAARAKEHLEWSNRDNQAIGFIQLRLSINLYNHVGTSSYNTWKNLEEAFW
jgi:hypothetical protein